MNKPLIIRWGVGIGVNLLVIGNLLMGFGLGPFSFNPINLIGAVFLFIIWATSARD